MIGHNIHGRRSSSADPRAAGERALCWRISQSGCIHGGRRLEPRTEAADDQGVKGVERRNRTNVAERLGGNG